MRTQPVDQRVPEVAWVLTGVAQSGDEQGSWMLPRPEGKFQICVRSYARGAICTDEVHRRAGDDTWASEDWDGRTTQVIRAHEAKNWEKAQWPWSGPLKNGHKDLWMPQRKRGAHRCKWDKSDDRSSQTGWSQTTDCTGWKWHTKKQSDLAVAHIRNVSKTGLS